MTDIDDEKREKIVMTIVVFAMFSIAVLICADMIAPWNGYLIGVVMFAALVATIWLL